MINANVFDATISTCFPPNTLTAANGDQLKLFLQIYEQQKKKEAKRLKDTKSRQNINSVNSRTVQQLIAADDVIAADDLADAEAKFKSSIERATKKAEDSIKQCELLADRSKKCNDMLIGLSQALATSKDISCIVKNAKRTVNWCLNNAEQADELWAVARQEKTKVARLHPATDEGRNALRDFEAAFDAQEERKIAFDIDSLTWPVADLAFAVRATCASEDEWVVALDKQLPPRA